MRYIVSFFTFFIVFYGFSLQAKDEPYYYEQWALHYNKDFYRKYKIDKNASIHSADILTKHNAKGITIAIIDDGIDLNHEDLKNAIIQYFDANRTTKCTMKDKHNFHGTKVIGIIAARKNSKGIMGLASGANIVFLKYKQNMSSDEFVLLFQKAIEYGADVINCSFIKFALTKKAINKINKITKKARNLKGVPIIFAAGNGNQNAYFDILKIPQVITVGATNSKNRRAWYSNFGKNLDIMAPGGNKLGITTLTSDNLYLRCNQKNRFTGTSAAAAIVTGVIALMLEKNPTLTAEEIKKILHETSDKIGKYSYKNGRNSKYGYGKINLYKIMNCLDTIK